MRSTIILALAAVASAHFSLNTPPSRGDNSASQDDGPCGGKNTPSTTRAKWSLSGGNQLSFEAGHDEAETAVYLAIGENPKEDDFTIILAKQFNQIGLGEFCWNDLEIPAGTKGAEDGAKATIQIVQRGHSGGGLYNCADVVLTSAALRFEPCKNATGVTAEAVSEGDDHDEEDHEHDEEKDETKATTTSATDSESSGTAAPASSETPDSAAGLAVGSMLFATVMAAGGALFL